MNTASAALFPCSIISPLHSPGFSFFVFCHLSGFTLHPLIHSPVILWPLSNHFLTISLAIIRSLVGLLLAILWPFSSHSLAILISGCSPAILLPFSRLSLVILCPFSNCYLAILLLILWLFSGHSLLSGHFKAILLPSLIL